MSNPIVSITTPSPTQIALDLTCALVTNGMFRFRALDSQGRLDELLLFIAANAQKIPQADAVLADAMKISAPHSRE